ncbi:DUF6350 family protein [Rothia sp. ZJ932]|uniref:cell division protein PerM n=1 Tax=Rothia sp. ZJ932 TaxID=2810516 RepID=UPI001967EF32|nr:DUF6350 family protein [Rothia sp. ZJ932]QRZ61268.1 hypothetical protein JR346_08475 [Rothia sp. ZJ932]
MKTPASSPQTAPARTIPMPLWLQGIVEFFVAAFSSLCAVFLLVGAVALTNDLAHGSSLVTAGQVASNIWLLMHGAPLNLNIPVNGVFAAIAGTVSLAPLGLTLLPLALTFRSGRRLAQASYEGQFWVPIVSGLFFYAAVAAAASFLGATPFISTPLSTSVLMTVAVGLCGAVAGGYYESRSLARMIGVNAATWVRRFSQYSRWTGSYVWALVRSVVVGFLAFVVGGAVLAAVALIYNWNDVIATYQSLHAGVVGDTAITLLQMGFVPNFVVYAMSWSTGAGFALGEGTTINLQTTDVGLMPALPLLSALPQPVEPWSLFVLSVPVIAGLAAGWWFFREGENHFDEWLSLKLSYRWLSWPLSHLFLAILVGALSGVLAFITGALAHGSLGLGRLTDIGADPLLFAAHTAVLMAIGVFLGSIVAPFAELDNSSELDRFASTATNRKSSDHQRSGAFWKKGSRRSTANSLETPVIEGEVVEAGTQDTPDKVDNPFARLFADEELPGSVRAEEHESSEKTADNAEDPDQQQVAAVETVVESPAESVTAADQKDNAAQKPVTETEPAEKKRPIIRRPKAKKYRQSAE